MLNDQFSVTNFSLIKCFGNCKMVLKHRDMKPYNHCLGFTTGIECQSTH